MTQTQTKTLRVKEGRTELTTDHNGRDLTFVAPSYGPNTYAQVGEQIDAAGLQRPTMAETASLVHTAFNSDDKYSTEIKQIMKDRWLWVFEKNLYLPGKGVYIYPQPKGGIPNMTESELERKLEASDPSVRFVPFGYETGSMSSMKLSKNPYVIALAGEEGAEKLAEVADKFEQEPCLYSYKSVNQRLEGVSALYSSRYLGRWLGVFGFNHGDVRGGLAFGVCSAREK
ncbi:hypothetical protein HYX18_04415 [Candidatus Woesearchaeota archaeon]|nr:hypothetical protein [Candidatus Woesearchaeota archaeon]